MTIRLLCAYSTYPVNAIVTLDAATETGLVAAKMASTNLSGGVAYIAPTPPNQLSNAQVIKDGVGNVIGLADVNGNKLNVGSVAAVITGSGIVGQPLTATLPAGVIGTLQFTKTLLASPFTKSNIATAVANAVNSLQYTPSQGDLLYRIGCDASNTVAPSVGVTLTAAPSSDVAPSVLTQAAITGTPQEGVALSIIGATFGGSPAPNVARVIRMDGVQVASGDQTTGYTPPVGASAGKIPSVTETASNGVGQAASSTATGAAVVAGAAQSLPASESWEVFSSITANAVRTGLLSSTRTNMSIANPATNLQTMEYVLVDKVNSDRNVPSTGWVELPPGAQDNITDADAKKQMFTRVRASDTKAVTAATCSGTTATYTVPNHGLTGSSNVRGFEGITPAGYNIRNVFVTAVDPNTLTATILATQAAATAFGVMLNCQESVNTRRLEPK